MSGATRGERLTVAFAGEPRQLAPAFLTVHAISNAIFTGVLGVGVLTGIVVSAFVDDDRPAWASWTLAAAVLALVIAIGAFGHWWGRRSYRAMAYAVSPLGLEIQRGVWWRKVIAVPRSRIQHTDVTQGPIQRAYGLATLVVFTAGVEHAQIDLPGLALETAAALRLDLLEHDGSALEHQPDGHDGARADAPIQAAPASKQPAAAAPIGDRADVPDA